MILISRENDIIGLGLETASKLRNALAINTLVCKDWICKLLYLFGRVPCLHPSHSLNYVWTENCVPIQKKIIVIVSNQIFKIPTSPPVASKEPSLLNANDNCCPTSSKGLSTSWESFSPSFPSPASFSVSTLNRLNKVSRILIKNQHFSSYKVV